MDQKGMGKRGTSDLAVDSIGLLLSKSWSLQVVLSSVWTLYTSMEASKKFYGTDTVWLVQL